MHNSTDVSVTGRIGAVDGLRAIAVLGVVWAHIWTFSGNPKLLLGIFGMGKFDLNRVISIVGSGVDLFFVISGFCMYWMYARKNLLFDWFAYKALIQARWLRIAPAFYTASLACAVGLLLANGTFPTWRMFGHLLFLNGVLPGAWNLAPPFWSLATEWQFYVVLPLLCYGAYRFSFWGAALVSVFACVLFRCAVQLASPELAETLQGQLPFRLVEFVWGMGVAFLFSKQIPPPWFLQGIAGFLFGLGIAYLGRLLRVTEMVQYVHTYGPLAKALAEPVMSFGFAIILWSAIGSDSIISHTLCLKPFTTLGRWSYSLYLWHWFPCLWIGEGIRRSFGSSPLSQHCAFFAALLVLLPLSWASFRFLEQSYFRKKHHP